MGTRIDTSLVPQTRVSQWRPGGRAAPTIYLKHEEEGRFAITAGKLRKFASLMPHLRKAGTQLATVIGSANSNNVVAACQLLLQAGIQPVPILKRSATPGTNQFLLSLLVDESEWQQVDAADWPRVHQISADFVQNKRQQGISCAEIVEGSCQIEALPGAMTLAADVQRNQNELGLTFSDIFMDAGTGLSAAALAMGMRELGMGCRLHITLMADSQEAFWAKADEFERWYASIFQRPAPDWRSRVHLHKPQFAASFGSVNAQVLASVRKYAREGLLTDPIYSAKHLATAEHIIKNTHLPMQNVLIIHSGGAQVLPGFAHRFQADR